MKPTRKIHDVLYSSPKRHKHTPYTVRNRQPYHQYFPGAQQYSMQNVSSYGSSSTNGYVYNNGTNNNVMGWPMHPPTQLPIHPPIQQFSNQSIHRFPQLNTGHPCPNSISRNVPQFSLPPPTHPFNGHYNGLHSLDQPFTMPAVRARVQNEPMKTKQAEKKWNREDALRALALEEELCKRNTTAPCLVVRFPDPPLDREKVKSFSSQIEAVHFQKNSAPRFCFVRLKDDADAAKAIDEISKIPFGQGLVSAELRNGPTKPPPTTKPEHVDPYSLYVGNLSLAVTIKMVKQYFPGAKKYDLAFKSKEKPVRYAFISYENLENAIEAFRNAIKLQIDGRSLVVRFRRAKSNCPAEAPLSNDQANNGSIINNAVTVSVAESNCSPTENVVEEENNLERTANPMINVGTAVKDENGNAKNESNAIMPIKQEHYDSDCSYDDECFRFNDADQTDIKPSVSDDTQPYATNDTEFVTYESDDDYDDGEYLEKHIELSSDSSASLGYYSNTTPICVANRKPNITNMPTTEDNMNEVIRNLKSEEITTCVLPHRVSLTEKKYLENLYDQLHSSNVLKREAHSDLNEFDEMLREMN